MLFRARTASPDVRGSRIEIDRREGDEYVGKYFHGHSEDGHATRWRVDTGHVTEMRNFSGDLLDRNTFWRNLYAIHPEDLSKMTNNIQVGDTFKTTHGKTVTIVSKIEAPGAGNAPFVGVVLRANGEFSTVSRFREDGTSNGGSMRRMPDTKALWYAATAEARVAARGVIRGLPFRTAERYLQLDFCGNERAIYDLVRNDSSL